jgi:hypothetical protein
MLNQLIPVSLFLRLTWMLQSRRESYRPWYAFPFPSSWCIPFKTGQLIYFQRLDRIMQPHEALTQIIINVDPRTLVRLLTTCQGLRSFAEQVNKSILIRIPTRFADRSNDPILERCHNFLWLISQQHGLDQAKTKEHRLDTTHHLFEEFRTRASSVRSMEMEMAAD